MKAASHEVHGHALTLSLLGRYLAKAHGGDIQRRDRVDFAKASRVAGGHAFRVVAAYEQWFANAGEAGARELAALRLLGFFDRPAPAELLATLRSAPAIPGLTEPLQGLDEADWNLTLSNLSDCRLAWPDEKRGALDAHPLVREYLAAALKNRRPEAWREGHRRLYTRLKESAPPQPEGLPGLEPLYQAVTHGCLAGLYEEARAEVYRNRILRGARPGGFYSAKQLGAFGANLGAVANFFEEPWRRPAAAFSDAPRAWLLAEAAFCLRALGRLEEALEPMRAGAEMRVHQKHWKNAGRNYSNLSELLVTLGRISDAVATADEAVVYADRSRDGFQRTSKRATAADVAHQQGAADAARTLFEQAESIQVRLRPHKPLLYSLSGFRYCDLLLAEANGRRGAVPEILSWLGTALR